jgi:hypothetical protein
MAMGNRQAKRVGMTSQLVEGRDDDLIQWYRGLPPGTAASEINRLLRVALELPQPSLPDMPILEAVTKEEIYQKINTELDRFAVDFWEAAQKQMQKFVQEEIQRALSSIDYHPVSHIAPATAKVDAEKLKQRAKNIDKDSW